jgi:membrane-associated phospholipid phosphatase
MIASDFAPRGVRPMDTLTLGYFAVISLLVVIFHNQVRSWYGFPLVFAIGTLVALTLIRAHARYPGNRVVALLRYTYPLVFSPFVYGSIGQYVLVFRGHFVDAGMNDFEARVYGGHPTEWLGHVVSRPLTELLYVCYFGFYLFFLIPPLVLFGARRDVDIERYVTPLLTALYVCYLGFLVVPLLGPGESLAGSLRPATLDGYVLVPLQRFLMAHGDPLGACFPSAHVAGAWAGLFAIRRLWGRRALRVALVPTIGLTIAVVYTRYHYLTDAIGGFAVAIGAFVLASRLLAEPVPVAAESLAGRDRLDAA